MEDMMRYATDQGRDLYHKQLPYRIGRYNCTAGISYTDIADLDEYARKLLVIAKPYGSDSSSTPWLVVMRADDGSVWGLDTILIDTEGVIAVVATVGGGPISGGVLVSRRDLAYHEYMSIWRGVDNGIIETMQIANGMSRPPASVERPGIEVHVEGNAEGGFSVRHPRMSFRRYPSWESLLGALGSMGVDINNWPPYDGGWVCLDTNIKDT